MTKRRIFTDTVLRQRDGDSRWCIMSRKRTGWSAFSYEYDTITALLGEWAITLGAAGVDEHGFYVEARPA